MADTAQIDAAPVRREEDESGGRMSFFDHLVELRKRIISSLLAIGVGMVVGLLACKEVLKYVEEPIRTALVANHLDPKIYVHSLQGYVGLYINIGLYVGVALAMPFVLYQVWLFVAPGLYKNERHAVSGFVFSSMALFLSGVAFGYFVLLPQVLTFLVRFVNDGSVTPWIDINQYVDLVLVILVGLGVIFELPVLIFILSVFGIVTPKFLLKNFRYAMLVITVIAAVVTPTPDATTMLIFMLPMIGLYMIGVGVSYVVVRRKRARALAGAEVQPNAQS